MSKIIRFFGLKGSWSWACKQMKKGYIVKPKNITGAVKYKIDDIENGLILYSFTHKPYTEKNWESANIFMDDIERTDWMIV